MSYFSHHNHNTNKGVPAMASITQDMKYRLSSTANTFTATNGVMTALWSLCAIGSGTLTSIPLRKLSCSTIRADAILMPTWSFSGSNSDKGGPLHPRTLPFSKKAGDYGAVHPPNPKYIPKPYEQMNYPGQRIQVDVKFVSSTCLKNSKVIGKRFFQYTAID